jgi:hypothetical protein
VLEKAGMNCILALILCAQIAAEKPDTDRQQEVNATLTQFAAKMKSASDKQAKQALTELNQRIRDEDLAQVEKFAAGKDAIGLEIAFAWLLVNRERFDSAASLMVQDLIAAKNNRRYAMWKWWEHHFGERKDYRAMTWKITDSLLLQFEKGNDDQKLVVAELFGKGKNEAKLTLQEFKKAIEYEKKKEASEKAEESKDKSEGKE